MYEAFCTGKLHLVQSRASSTYKWWYRDAKQYDIIGITVIADSTVMFLNSIVLSFKE